MAVWIQSLLNVTKRCFYGR